IDAHKTIFKTKLEVPFGGMLSANSAGDNNNYLIGGVANRAYWEKGIALMKGNKAVHQNPADTINPSTSKRQRGRPRKNGMKSLDAFGRALWGLHWFNKAR